MSCVTVKLQKLKHRCPFIFTGIRVMKSKLDGIIVQHTAVQKRDVFVSRKSSCTVYESISETLWAKCRVVGH
jgi:hypothetical protein